MAHLALDFTSDHTMRRRAFDQFPQFNMLNRLNIVNTIHVSDYRTRERASLTTMLQPVYSPLKFLFQSRMSVYVLAEGSVQK